MSRKYDEWEGSYVTADGEYGEGVITFDSDLLTDEQFELFTEMVGSDRAPYIISILDGDTEETARLEAEYRLD